MSLLFGFHMPNFTYADVAAPQAGEILQGYVDAGFGGFTLNNAVLPTPEAIARAGELIKLMNGKPA